MRVRVRSVLLFTAAALIGCGESGTGTESPRAVVTSGPTDIELIPGGSRYIVYSVERIAGHSGAVQLSATGVPEGVLARFHPPVVTTGALVSSLEVTVSPTASTGTYTFNTIATGAGVQATSIPVTITIVVPGVSLASASSSLVFEQGKSVSTALNVSRTGGFSGVVGLTVSGLPPGVTASLGSTTLQGGETATTLTVAAALDAPIGNFAVTVTAASPGIATRSVSIPVTVATGTTPAVVLSASPSASAIMRGLSSQVTLNVVRFAGYNGPLSIAVEGLPANVTASVAPIAAGATSTTLVLTASENADAPLSAVLTLRARGTGIADAVIPFTVNVIEAPTFRFNFTRNGQNSPPVRALGVDVARGTYVSVGGQIDRVSGFSESVTVSIIGLPPGLRLVRYTIVPQEHEEPLPLVLPASSATFQQLFLTVRADANVAPGTYDAVLRGVASGGLTVDALVSIRVM